LIRVHTLETGIMFKEIAPHTKLKPYIRCYNLFENTGTHPAGNHMFLSDGSMEMFFVTRNHISHMVKPGIYQTYDSGYAVGAFHTHYTVDLDRVSFISVRFRPGGSYPFFRLPAEHITNSLVSLETLLGKKGKKLTRFMQSCKHTSDEKRHALDRFFLDGLDSLLNPDHSLHGAINEIFTHHGNIKIHSLAKTLRLSNRQLERKFKEKVGVTPKQLGRIIRLRSSIQYYIKTGNLTQSALETGFFDQAHMTNEFKYFTDMTPLEYFTSFETKKDLIST